MPGVVVGHTGRGGAGCAPSGALGQPTVGIKVAVERSPCVLPWLVRSKGATVSPSTAVFALRTSQAHA